MKVNIFNDSDSLSIDKKKIVNLVKKVAKEEKFTVHELNIVIADNKYLKKLNKIFFKKNRPTNVISFNMGEISEIYISCDKLKNNDDLYYYIIHGLLHIIGYDHRTKKENTIMNNKCVQYLPYV